MYARHCVKCFMYTVLLNFYTYKIDALFVIIYT